MNYVKIIRVQYAYFAFYSTYYFLRIYFTRADAYELKTSLKWIICQLWKKESLFLGSYPQISLFFSKKKSIPNSEQTFPHICVII